MSTYSTTSSEKLLSACGGALVTSVMVTPMDVIKMRLQTQNVYTPLAKNTCCLTFDRCTLTQAMKFTKKSFPSRGKVQVAKLHECALQHPTPNSQMFKGTFVSIFIRTARHWLLIHANRTAFIKLSNMKALLRCGKDYHQHY